jgi:lantibiotic leader peptide-processing serine protease
MKRGFTFPQRRKLLRALTLGVGAAVAAGMTLTASTTTASATGEAQNYLVLFSGSSSPSNAADLVAQAGGTVVANYAQIGVLVARSDNTAFDATISRNAAVEGAEATGDYATRLDDGIDVAGEVAAQPGDLPNAPASDTDSLSALQWDMRQIHTPEAHAITGGSPTVVAGTIDTGVDYRHPDLRQNISDADSANCLSGTPVPGAAAADDDHGHGTHTAGTMAAAANGAGIVGVAPNVRIAGIKAATAEGYFFPEAVVCAFVWAGTRHLDVTNNSYFVDPFLFNCRNEAAQRVIWKAVQRAILYALNQGVTVVASEGNSSEDLSHPTMDATSPDYPPGNEVLREINNACVVIPVEIPGVIGVTATGSFNQGTNAGDYPDHLKAYYSSYGVSTADVAAPGGDFYFRDVDDPAAAINGLILSTWPATRPCSRSVQEPTGEVTYPTATYCYLQGTSMAGPHVAGVAALVISRYGDLQNPQNGKMRPIQVEQFVTQTADPQVCPETLPNATSGSLAGRPYSAFVGSESGATQQCQGDGIGHTSWYGVGEVDAHAAVTNDRSNG